MNEMTLICAKFGTDLTNTSEVISSKAMWPRYLSHPVHTYVPICLI